MKPLSIDPEMTVDEIMRRWPATIRVFIVHRMLCIGCPIGIFHTVSDACAAHGLDVQAFSHELLAAMRGDPLANSPSVFAARAAPQDGVRCGTADLTVRRIGRKLGSRRRVSLLAGQYLKNWNSIPIWNRILYAHRGSEETT